MIGRPTLRVFAVLLIAALAMMLAPGLADAQYVDAYFNRFGKNKVQFKNFKWKVYHSPHFDIYYYTEDADLLQKVVSYAESAYDQLSQEFDYQMQKATPLIFYETHAHFEQNNEFAGQIPEGIGAFASSVRNRMFMPVDLPDPELYTLILHELTHIFQYHILFGGRLGKGVSANAPQWLMEGMASYMEGEESARDKMFVRDAVVNDNIPPIASGGASGFFAYRFGYAVFEFMEERWGKEGFRDFLIEFRNTLGGRVGKAIERAFQMTPEDFDIEFRRHLRKRYLAELLETGEPSDFGRPFRVESRWAQAVSPSASPSGDLVAAFSTERADVDVVIYDTQTRSQLKNLTKGFTSEYQYYIAQEMTMGRKQGRDLEFSPDGNRVAFFARRNRGRHLVLVDVLKGKIRESIPMDVGQQFSPTWHPEGDRVAFSAWQNGQFDIFEIDLATEEVTNLTNDDIFDASPVYAPDGESMLFTSVVGGYSKIFRVDLDDPTIRMPLREGVRSQSNETDPVFTADGRRVYFTSDGTGSNNIFSIDLDSGLVQQHTNTVTGCFQPTMLTAPDGGDRIVYTGYWKGRFDLYLLDVDEPITEATEVTEEQIAEVQSLRADELPKFEPSIEVTLDDANKDRYGGLKFYLQDVFGGTIGVSNDQTFVASIGFIFSDFMGDRKIIAAFQSISSFQNFDVVYQNLSNRLGWSVHLFDRNDFFVGVRQDTGEVVRGDQVLKETGLIGSGIYPLGVNHRVTFGGGYMLRELDFVAIARDEDGFPIFDDDGNFIFLVTPRDDDYPIIRASFVGDTSHRNPFGGWSGRRYKLWGNYAPDLDDTGDSSALTATLGGEFRAYLPLTRRTYFAYRLFGASSDGNFPTPIYIGGLDTIRGFDFRSLVGDNAFYQNIELRLPVVDVLAFPFMVIQGIQGNIFLDVGGVWFDQIGFKFWDSENDKLQDGVSSYGFGISARIFGMQWNWDFAKRWDFDSTLSDGLETSFWIGRRF